jgi:hypothetical protein
MHKRRQSPPNGHNEAANRMIRIILVTIGCVILGSMAFETVLGIPPSPLEVFGLATLIVIGMWLKENA